MKLYSEKRNTFLFKSYKFIRPWPCRDLHSFLMNIKRMPLRFPYDKPISKDTKDLLTKMLVVSES